MRGKLTALLLAAALAISASAQVANVRAKAFAHIPTQMNEIVPGQIMVKYSEAQAASIEARAKTPSPVAVGAYGETFANRISNTGWTLWRVPMNTDVRALAQTLKQTRSDVLCAEPVNRIYMLDLPAPNDPDFFALETDTALIFNANGDPVPFRRLWNLDDIDAFGGWNVYPRMWLTATRQPGFRPLIAFIDTGCDITHPEFINAGGTGTDVSQGGQLELSLSKQFTLGAVNPTGTVDDANGHGTHVTGIAIASGNNGPFDSSTNNGMIGIGYNARGMILRVFDASGNGSDADAAAAIYYAADHGADIINLSLGTTNFSQVFQDAVTYAFQKGSAVICAGNENGNGGGNLGPIYPAACSGAYGVTACGPNGMVAVDYAGYGSYIQLAAPGGEVVTSPDLTQFQIEYIWSSAMQTPGQLYALSQQGAVFPPYNLDYAYLAGTSMACPHVSGAAAQYWAHLSFRQTAGYANVRLYRALSYSAQSNLGAPLGGWELNQGYGELDLHQLNLNMDTRSSTVGSIDGIVYYNETPISNVAVKAKIGATTYSTTTQADGTYRFDQLPPGLASMSAAPFGAMKTKRTIVRAGSDTPGVDFHAGTYHTDTTKPVIYRLVPFGAHTATRLNLFFWAYDTESGIDRIDLKVGTTSGGSDVYKINDALTDNGTFGLPMNIPLGQTYYVTATVTNGAGLTQTKTTSFAW